MKIRTKLVLIFVTLTLSYLVTTFVSVEIIQNQITDTIGFYSVQATKSTLANIYHRIEGNTNELVSVTDDAEILGFIKNSNSDFEKIENLDDYINKIDNDWQERKDLPIISDILTNDLSVRLLSYQDHFRTHDNKQAFSEIFITNKHGVVIGSTDRTSDYLQSDENWYVGAMSEKNHAWIGQPEYDESSKAYSIDIVTTIKDENGDFVGVIKGVLNLYYLKDDLADLQKNIPYQNTPYIVDPDGYSILSVDSENLSSFTSDTELKEFGTNLSTLAPVKLARVDDSGFLMWSDGTSDKFTTYTAILKLEYPEKLGWILLLDFEKNEIMAPLINLQDTLVVIGIIISMASGIVGYYFARNISNPIESLYVAANNMGRGNLDQQVMVHSKDEIGKLCESFNAMSKDVKRKIELEKELAIAQKQVKDEKLLAVGELSSRIAHDLRNPLSTIRNSCELLSRTRDAQDDKSKRYISLIQRSVNRMSHQIDDVLDYVRTTPADKKAESCLSAIKSVIDLNPPPENIKMEISKQDLMVVFDAQKIEVVFTNILRNAVQAIGNKGGTININVSQQPGRAIIEFADSGQGIADGDLPRIFDPLFTTKQEGTGLGLSSCKNIVEQHGGKIEVLLNPTRFQICLPM
ncbi:MAG: ATP-binding protein [Nitrososphaerota archaeon]